MSRVPPFPERDLRHLPRHVCVPVMARPLHTAAVRGDNPADADAVSDVISALVQSLANAADALALLGCARSPAASRAHTLRAQHAERTVRLITTERTVRSRLCIWWSKLTHEHVVCVSVCVCLCSTIVLHVAGVITYLPVYPSPPPCPHPLLVFPSPFSKVPASAGGAEDHGGRGPVCNARTAVQ